MKPTAFRLWALLLGALWASFAARPASAYPQFVFKGYGDCNSCHHSPSGGGLPNRWGRDSLGVTFESGVGWGNDDLADDPAAPSSLKADLGLDLRLMTLAGSDGDATIGPTFIPMLTELGGAAALGRWMLYGTVTARKTAGFVAFSREHWLKYQPSASLNLRLGRMVLPFGIRQPDHTQYVREDFEFDKYDQSYGAEVDFNAGGWSLFGNVFAGDLIGRPKERQERGAVLSAQRDIGSNAAVGVSALGSLSTARNRIAGSLFGRSALGASLYLLGEIAAQQFTAQEGDAKLSTLAEYLRLGWFAQPAMDVYVEAGHRTFLAGEGLTKERVALGLNWQLLRWFEFAPQVLVEARSGLPARLIGMGQLHVVY